MLSEKMEQILNQQVNAELYSAYLYYSMSAWCQTKDLTGFASWFRVQALEELTHADKLFNYIHDRDGRVRLTEIKTPDPEWESPLAVFEAALGHEQHVTRLINRCVDVAKEESDHNSDNFLQWFVAEQVEEEATASEIVGKLRIVGNEGYGLFMVDQELGQRQFVPPPTE